MSIFDKIGRILGKVDKAKQILATARELAEQSGPFPPFPFCPICNRRTSWIEQGKVWDCPEGHRFTVQMHSTNPPDKPARDYRGETEI